jgi:hypothetical protein
MDLRSTNLNRMTDQPNIVAARLGADDKRDLDRLLTRGTPRWLPLQGPQAEAYDCQADFLFYGGSAGGGKTDLALGLALTAHRRAIVFRREYKQLRAIIDRTAEIVGGLKGFNGRDKIWTLPGARRLEFGACQHPGDEKGFQGRPHDLKAFDEISHFLESQFRFLCGWLRTTEAGQRCRVLCTGNPPTDAEGEWVIRFWAPWLDEHHPNPALPGELRWYAMIDGTEVEVETGEPFDHKGEIIRPKSRTFIPSSVEDNPFLMGTGYKAMLQALPEPLRSQMLKGDFTKGMEDDPWQIIPTRWIKAAQDRWTPTRPDTSMTALGVDVARGGRDKTVLSPRFGPWFAEQKVYPGVETPDGPATAALVVAALRNAAPVHIDVVGVGGSVYDHLCGNNVHAVAMNGAAASNATDRSGRLGFANKRAEWWWRMREALDPDYGDGLALPPEAELRADLAASRWKLTARGIQVEAKEETVKRIGRSPDRGDAAVYALPTTRRAARKGGVPRVERSYDPLRW